MFDPFQQAKLMGRFNELKSAQPTSKPIDSIDDLKKLAGVNNQTSYGESISGQGTNLGQIQRERNIRPGTDEWFRLWFAKPHITGEQPYDK